MWRLGFFFHEMAFGLLSVFLPLHIVAIGGSLVDIGIMFAVALLLQIPASFVWGYICDKTRRYTRYILISFIALSFLLYLFTLTTNVGLLVTLYSVMSILHVAHESPKNVLISELYSRKEWEKTFAVYGGFTKIGWLVGLLLGALLSVYRCAPTSMLLLCSGLNLVAFVASIVLVTDPLLVFERTLVRIERTVDFTYKGVVIATKILNGLSPKERLKRENLSAFCSGLVLFSLATRILSTPLPIFFSKELGLPASVIFAIYVLNSGGGVIGYFLVSGRSSQPAEKSHITRIVMFRGILTFLLMTITWMPVYGVVLAAVILTLMAFAYALFLVFTLSLSMELLPTGKAGLFNVMVGIGGACGSFVGPFLAQTLGFTYIFLTAGIIFSVAYASFKLSSA